MAEELTSLPGAEEIAALLELRSQVESGPWDLVVVDCAPTAETLRLLALPEALAWHLDRLLPGPAGADPQPATRGRGGRRRAAARRREVLDVVTGWHRHLRAVQRLLTGEHTSVRLVLTPERVVIAESRRTWTSLSLYGFVVDAVVVNRVFPDAAQEAGSDGRPDAWRSGWNAAQRTGLVEVRESFAGLPVVVSPYLAREPIGPDALEDARARARTPTVRMPPDLLEPVAHRGMTVTRTDDGFTLSLPLPLVSAADVGLQRRDDELLVAVGDHRRVLTLPAALQRCVVRGASVREGLSAGALRPRPGGLAPWLIDSIRTEPVGTVAEETARLVEALGDWARSATAGEAAQPDQAAPDRLPRTRPTTPVEATMQGRPPSRAGAARQRTRRARGIPRV